MPWLNDAGTSEIKEHTLEGVTPQYLDYKKSKLREKSVKRDRVSINQLCEFIGYGKSVSEIDCFDIEGSKGLIVH